MRDSVPRGHILELDAVRAIGLATVVAAHASTGRGAEFSFVWLFMDLFFVLSGFLICGILLDTRDRTTYYRDFYTRRALRILPAYYLLLLAVVTLARFGDPEPLKLMERDWGSPAWFFVYLGNVPSADVGFLPSWWGGALAPLWSLQVEEQFYLLFPVLVRHLDGRALHRALVALIVVSIGLRGAAILHDPDNAQLWWSLLPTRFDGLAIGSLIALAYRRGFSPRPSRALLAAAVIAPLCALAAMQWSGLTPIKPLTALVGPTMFAASSGLLLIAILTHRGQPVTALLRHPVLLRLGKVSYGGYLFHLPALGLFTAALGRAGYSVPSSWRIPVALLLTWFAAQASWRWIEAPCLRARDARRPADGTALSAAPAPAVGPSESPPCAAMEGRAPATPS